MDPPQLALSSDVVGGSVFGSQVLDEWLVVVNRSESCSKHLLLLEAAQRCNKIFGSLALIDAGLFN